MEGLVGQSKTPVVLVSEQMHYSMTGNSMALGIGAKNVRKLRTNGNGQIIVSELRSQLAELKTGSQSDQFEPVIVSCMAGSTVLGCFDDFDGIADVCEEFNVPMHVDACWGGNLMFSQRESIKNGVWKGIERADYIAYDAHKQLQVPLLCSAVLAKHGAGELPVVCQPVGAEYLYHTTGRLDLGKKTMQCSRRGDALAFYLTLLKHGMDGMSAKVDLAMDNAGILYELLCESESQSTKSEFAGDFITVQRVADGGPHYCNVPFYYIGKGSGLSSESIALLKSFKADDFAVDSPVRTHPGFQAMCDSLRMCTKKIHSNIKQGGKALVDFAPLPSHGLPEFIRPVTPNPKIDRDSLVYFLRLVKEAAQQ